MNTNFETLCKFMGYGNPDADIWFMGIEEHDEIEFSDQKMSDYNRLIKPLPQGWVKSTKDEHQGKFTEVYDFMAKIVKGTDKLSEDINVDLFSENGLCFHMNLFPIPKPSTKGPVCIHTLKYFELNDYTEYLKKVESYRYPEIRKFLNKYQEKVIICFGATYWNDFKTLYELHDSEPIYKSNKIEIYKYVTHHIILTPFLQSRFIKNIFNELNNEIKKLVIKRKLI